MSATGGSAHCCNPKVHERETHSWSSMFPFSMNGNGVVNAVVLYMVPLGNAHRIPAGQIAVH
jgi:hypothetical protein